MNAEHKQPSKPAEGRQRRLPSTRGWRTTSTTGHRHRRRGATALVALLIGSLLAATPPAAAADGNVMRFGMDVSSIDELQAEGIPPDYAIFWVGPWNMPDAWGTPESELKKAHAADVTPVIHYYYWGDDISPSCFDNGCNGKSRGEWDDLAQGLVDRLNAHTKGGPAIIVLETEFNKGGIDEYEPFDKALADKARFFKQHYPAATIVLGFGNWGQSKWGNMDQTMAVADMTGLQAMRGSTRHNLDQYLAAADKTLTGAQLLQDLYGKPVLITDIALSSYPEPEYRDHQEAALARFVERLPEFKAAGVEGMIYRGIEDNPNFGLDNHFGMAERYWGLVTPDGTWKPAMRTWVDAVKAERAAHAGTPTTPPPADDPPTTEPPATDAPADDAPSPAWRLDDDIAEKWVEVYLTPDEASSVEARVDGGDWQPLTQRSWGSWATSSVSVPNGSTVALRATLGDGTIVESPSYLWPSGAVTGAPADPGEGGDDGDAASPPAGNVSGTVTDREAPGPGVLLAALLAMGVGLTRRRHA